MSLGFNSNVQLGGALYHVQTEERGASHPYIDTVVFSQGKVLHRRSTSFQDLIAGGAADPAALHTRVERQHSDVMAALRAGALPLETMPQAPRTPQSDTGIAIKLRNPASWLAAGRATLEIEVLSRGLGGPVAGAEINVWLVGTVESTAKFIAQTDAQGRACIQFSMPRFAHPEKAEMIVQATTKHAREQLHYRLKPKARPSVPPVP